MGEKWFPEETGRAVVRIRGSGCYAAKNYSGVLQRDYHPDSCFLFGENEGQREIGTCLRSCSELAAEVGTESRAPHPQPLKASA